jgi:hypothetical protein
MLPQIVPKTMIGNIFSFYSNYSGKIKTVDVHELYQEAGMHEDRAFRCYWENHSVMVTQLGGYE